MHRPSPPWRAPVSLPPRAATRMALVAGLVAMAAVAVACDTGTPVATPPITPGTGGTPREVNIVARDYAFVPTTVDLVPGETVTFHLLNGGLVIHEAILGDMGTQLAWEAAEAPYADAPPGPTPFVSPPPEFDGVRMVVESGQRLDVTWTVPVDAASDPSGWFVGCHIPGHWAKGMVVPVRFVGRDGRPLASGSPASGSPASSVPPASGSPASSVPPASGSPASSVPPASPGSAGG